MDGGGPEEPDPFASTTFGLVNEPSTLDSKESEGIMGCYGYYEELATPASKSYVDAMHAKFGAGIPYISELACATYEGVHIWAEGVKKAGSVDRVKEIEALEGGIKVAGPSGEVTVDKPTHHAIRSTYLAVVKDKKWDVVETYPDQPPADTAAVCDLVKKPNDNQQYVVKI